MCFLGSFAFAEKKASSLNSAFWHKDVVAAFKTYSAIANKNPRSISPLQDYACAAAELGWDTRVQEACNKIIAIHSTSAWAWQTRGWNALYQGNPAEAKHCFNIALASAPLSADVWYGLGMTAQIAQDLDSAAAWYREIIGRYPYEAGAYYMLGTIDLAQGRYQEAEKNYKAALKKDYGMSEVYLSLTQVYMRSGQYDNAWRAADKFANIDPDHAAIKKLKTDELAGRISVPPEKITPPKHIDMHAQVTPGIISETLPYLRDPRQCEELSKSVNDPEDRAELTQLARTRAEDLSGLYSKLAMLCRSEKSSAYERASEIPPLFLS